MVEFDIKSKYETPIRAIKYADEKLSQMRMMMFQTVQEAEVYIKDSPFYEVFDCEKKTDVMINMPKPDGETK